MSSCCCTRSRVSRHGKRRRGSYRWSHFLTENRSPPRIKCGAGFFVKMLHCDRPPLGPNKALMTDFSPREIVSELDRFIVGQGDAKRAVAIALRNRWRRLKLDEKLREEVLPKNILMIGPTGVGKTEISRRLARL